MGAQAINSTTEQKYLKFTAHNKSVFPLLAQLEQTNDFVH